MILIDPDVEITDADDLQALFLIALGECDGNISKACELAEIARPQYTRWLLESPDFMESVGIVAEEIIDNAEQKLQDAINNNNLTAAIFFLKCKAKDRGYVERVEHTAKDGAPLTLEMNFGIPEKPGSNLIDVTPPKEPKELEE